MAGEDLGAAWGNSGDDLGAAWGASARPSSADPQAIIGRATAFGYSALSPEEKAFIDSGFASSAAAKRGLSLDEAHQIMDERANGKQIDNIGLAERRALDLDPTAAESLPTQLFPSFMSRRAEDKFTGEVGVGQQALALGRDVLNMPGRFFRAGLGVLPATWESAFPGHHAEIDSRGNTVAVENTDRAEPWRELGREVADPSGIFGDPSLAPMMALPMIAPEAIGARLAAAGMPRLGAAMIEYPKAFGAITYPAQGVMQGLGASTLSHNLSGRVEGAGPAADLTITAGSSPVAKYMPREAITPLNIGLNAGAGLLGLGGKWLEHASLEAVPGAAQLADMAQKTRRIGYAPTRAEKMEQISGLLDRSGALSESGLARYGQAQTELGADLANPVVMALGPKTHQYQQASRLAQHEGSYRDVSAFEPDRYAAGGLGYTPTGVPQREEELINTMGGLGVHRPESGIGPDLNAYGEEDFRRDLLGMVALANRNDNKAFRGLDEAALRRKVDEAVSSTFSKSLDRQGMAMPEVPALLGNLNKLAFDRWISTGKQSAKEIGKLGHSILAKKYWENTAMDAYQAGDMQMARKAFGEAKAVDELMNEAATGGMKKRGENAVGKLGGILGLDYAVPLIGRKLGKEISRRAETAARAANGERR